TPAPAPAAPGDAQQAAQVVFPLVAFGSSDGVDELSARMADDFRRHATGDSRDETDATPTVPAGTPDARLTRYATTLAADEPAPEPVASPTPAPAGAPDGQAGGSTPPGAPAPGTAAPDAPAPGAGAPAAPDAPQPAPGELPRQQVTFLLDTSGSMAVDEERGSRLSAVVADLSEVVTALGRADGTIGLWNYSSQLSPSARTPYRDNVDLTAGDRGDAVNAVLAQLTAGGATRTYESVLAAYDAAVRAADPAVPNRLVLITDGTDDGALPLDDARARIAALRGTAPVDLSIVAVGDDVDVPALRALAEAGGGRVEQTPSSNGTAVRDALLRLLTA
ncbi:VWA domain-containing protein, partial [Corynebacterium bovis]